MFKSEQLMVKVFRESLSKKISNQEQIEIFEEIGLGNGIADIVICFYAPNSDGRSLQKTTLNYHDVNIYQIVREKEEISEEEIIKITKISRRDVRYSLNVLHEESLIERTQDDLIKSREYEYPFKRNFAFELKLKNWKRGLYQAYRYRWFAHYSYLVIDYDHSMPARNEIDLFKKFNVGLAALDEDGQFYRFYNPKMEEPFDPKMKILFSEMLIKRQALDK